MKPAKSMREYADRQRKLSPKELRATEKSWKKFESERDEICRLKVKKEKP